MRAFVGCAGFGLVEVVLRSFGFEVVGVEIEDAVAEVNRMNGGHCLTADLLAVDPAAYVGWRLMHFSPPCPNFSLANQGGSETEGDLALARKICEFIRVGRPVYFTLENVWGYRKSLSWLLIWYTLLEGGYGVEVWNLNAADYGVPQSRRRMIVIARRDGRRPAKPWPTHGRRPDMLTKPWVGWYEVIEDLLPSLPESRFARRQMDKMPEELKTFMMMTSNTNRNGVDNVTGRGVLEKGQPANTVMARAFLLGQGNHSYAKYSEEPADVVTANSNQTGVKAFVINSQNATRELTVRDGTEPMFVVSANALEKNSPPKGFIIGGQYQTPNYAARRVIQNRGSDRPIWTIRTNETDTRAWLEQGKVVAMTPRALARFQDFPDWFRLPENRGEACRGIGNALPPGVYRAVVKSLGFGE